MRKPVIGIAGGIGSGKSTVARGFAELGCVVADADADARAAFNDPTIHDELVARFGDDIVDDDGTIIRSRVAELVFGDDNHDDAREWLESLIHPFVHSARDTLFADAENDPDVPALIIDAPLLFEVGLDDMCDAVVFVECPIAIRLDRVMKHRGWDENELDRREQSQLPLDEKRERADYLLQNDRDQSNIVDDLRRILKAVCDAARSE